MQHRLDAVAVILKSLIGLVLGLTSSSCPDPDQIFSRLSAPVEIVPIMLEWQDQPLFERQRFRHLAVLHFMSWVVVADSLFRVLIKHNADVVTTVGQDYTGLTVGDDATANFGGHLIVLPDVCAVVAHGLSPVRRRPPWSVVAICIGMGYYGRLIGHNFEEVMVFKMDVSGNTFENVGTAVSVPHGADAELIFKDNDLIDCKNAIVQRDQAGLVRGLGLPTDTPIEEILSVLRIIHEKMGAPDEEKVEAIKESSLWPFIERSANLTSVIQGVIALGGLALEVPTAF